MENVNGTNERQPSSCLTASVTLTSALAAVKRNSAQSVEGLVCSTVTAGAHGKKAKTLEAVVLSGTGAPLK
jgi:hypothetical protein